MDCRPYSVSGRATAPFIVAGLCCLLVAGSLLMTPLQCGLGVAILLPCALVVAFWRVPMLGVYLATLVYPVGSIIVVVRGHTPYEVMIHWIELLAFPLLGARLLTLLCKHRPGEDRQTRAPRRWTSWVALFIALFFASGAVAVAGSESPVMSAYGLWRLAAALVLVDYLAANVKNMAQFRRVLWFYCAAGVMLAVAAVTATYHAFSVRIPLFEAFGSYVFCHAALFNMVSDFLAVLVGETSGYGLCAKHDLSLFMFAGVLIAAFLFLTNRNGRGRRLLLGLILCFEVMVYQAQSKLSIVGGLFVVGLFGMSVAPWRRRIAAILAVFIGLNVAGAVGARFLAPTHGKKLDSAVAGLQNATSASEFEPSSLAGRRMIWRRTFARVRRDTALGCGPDSLGKEFAFGIPHGHNLFLTVLAESGMIAALSLFAILTMVVVRAWRALASEIDPADPFWLLRVTLMACTLFTFFEYQFDMPVYRSHLWYMLGLLLASLNMERPSEGSIIVR